MHERLNSVVESEIEYRPPSIIGRVYKTCVLLGQLLLAPKCSPKSLLSLKQHGVASDRPKRSIISKNNYFRTPTS